MSKVVGRENGEVKKIECKVELPSGKKCGKKFTTMTELQDHIQKKHLNK